MRTFFGLSIESGDDFDPARSPASAAGIRSSAAVRAWYQTDVWLWVTLTHHWPPSRRAPFLGFKPESLFGKDCFGISKMEPCSYFGSAPHFFRCQCDRHSKPVACLIKHTLSGPRLKGAVRTGSSGATHYSHPCLDKYAVAIHNRTELAFVKPPLLVSRAFSYG